MKTLKERFDEKWIEDKETGCWEWQAAKNPKGYGQFGKDGSVKQAHRASWEFENGSIPHDMWVLHRCDNPSCVNPAHLFLGTNQDNVDDRVGKGRSASNKGATNGASKLQERDVVLIRQILKRFPPQQLKHGPSAGIQNFLARWFAVSQPVISAVYLNKSWKHVKV